MLFLQGPNANITALAFSPDGEQLAVGASDASIQLLRFDGSREELGPPSPLGGFANSLFFLAGESGILCQSGVLGGFGWYSVEENRWATPVTPGGAIADSSEYLPDLLALGYVSGRMEGSGRFELWDCQKQKAMTPSFLEPTGVRAVAAHAESRTVAWCNNNKRISIWPTNTLEPRAMMLTHNATSLAFHPDGEQLAAAMEWHVRVYSIETRTEKFALKAGHTGRVTKVLYSPNGRTIVTSSWDRTVRIWDAAGGSLLATFDLGIGRVQSLVFAADGLRLAAGGEDGKIAVWDMD
jgi:WD domain, G-beta repeat